MWRFYGWCARLVARVFAGWPGGVECVCRVRAVHAHVRSRLHVAYSPQRVVAFVAQVFWGRPTWANPDYESVLGTLSRLCRWVWLYRPGVLWPQVLAVRSALRFMTTSPVSCVVCVCYSVVYAVLGGSLVCLGSACYVTAVALLVVVLIGLEPIVSLMVEWLRLPWGYLYPVCVKVTQGVLLAVWFLGFMSFVTGLYLFLAYLLCCITSAALFLALGYVCLRAVLSSIWAYLAWHVRDYAWVRVVMVWGPHLDMEDLWRCTTYIHLLPWHVWSWVSAKVTQPRVGLGVIVRTLGYHLLLLLAALGFLCVALAVDITLCHLIVGQPCSVSIVVTLTWLNLERALLICSKPVYALSALAPWVTMLQIVVSFWVYLWYCTVALVFGLSRIFLMWLIKQVWLVLYTAWLAGSLVAGLLLVGFKWVPLALLWLAAAVLVAYLVFVCCVVLLLGVSVLFGIFGIFTLGPVPSVLVDLFMACLVMPFIATLFVCGAPNLVILGALYFLLACLILGAGVLCCVTRLMQLYLVVGLILGWPIWCWPVILGTVLILMRWLLSLP